MWGAHILVWVLIKLMGVVAIVEMNTYYPNFMVYTYHLRGMMLHVERHKRGTIMAYGRNGPQKMAATLRVHK